MSGGDEAILNLAAHFVDARVAEGLGGRPAIRTDERLWTYSDVANLSSSFASVLAGAEIRPEERVILALPDGAPFVGALFGILRRGAVAVMINPELPAELLTYFFEYTSARAALVHRAYLPAFEKATATLSPGPLVFVEDDDAFRHRLAVAPLDFPPFPTHRDDAAIWLFSGGTTGRPKAVVQPGRSFVNTTERYGHGVLGLTADDITISVPKLFFGYALGSNVLFPFSKGASCVLFPERSTPEALFRQIKRHRPSVLINVPTMVQQMVTQAAAGRHDMSSLRMATSAGEALPVELLDRWREAFGVELLDGLGTAEMWHIFISNRPGACVPGTLGPVVDGFEVRLCDDDGREVPDGEVGMLWVKGDSRALGYWRRLDDTARAFRGEWYVSGDMLQKNADGTFVYCGRTDDMLKISGKWLSPGELENCLLQHERVREAAVVGVKGDDGLVKPWAFVVCDQPGDELAEALQAFAKTRLERYKYPRKVVFVESLPRTHLGKVDRKQLAGTSLDPTVHQAIIREAFHATIARMTLPAYAMNQPSFPEMYERWLVAPLFQPWAELLADRVALHAGDRVLDVACGTGIVARTARGRVGADARVVGIDVSPAMLAVARSTDASIDWREGDAAALPCAEGETFDVVICQQGLQFFPDKPAAAREWHRVLAPGGRLAVATWRPLAEIPLFRDLHVIAERHLGTVADARYGFGEPAPLERLLNDAGFESVSVETLSKTVRLEEGNPFTRMNAMALVGMSAGGKTMTDDERGRVVNAIVADSESVIPSHSGADGLTFEIRTNVATARR